MTGIMPADYTPRPDKFNQLNVDEVSGRDRFTRTFGLESILTWLTLNRNDNAFLVMHMSPGLLCRSALSGVLPARFLDYYRAQMNCTVLKLVVCVTSVQNFGERQGSRGKSSGLARPLPSGERPGRPCVVTGS
jgi:hypothetical protein